MLKDQHPQGQEPPEDTGIPPDEAGKKGTEEKEELIAGRYKTKEDAEKGTRDADEKIRTQGRTIKDLEAELRGREAKDEQTRLAQTEEQVKMDSKAFAEVGEGFRQAFSKGAEEAGRYIYGLIEAHPTVQIGRSVQQQNALQRRHADIYAEMKKRHSDYDALIPKMRTIGGSLSREMMTNPSMQLMETIYKAAKGEVAPGDEAALRKKIADDERAGSGQGAGERHISKSDTRTEEQKKVDKAAAQYHRDKVDIG